MDPIQIRESLQCVLRRYRGGSGPLHVSRGKTNHPLHKAFIEAGQQAGYPFTEDMNGYQQEGLGWMDMTIFKGQEAKELLQLEDLYVGFIVRHDHTNMYPCVLISNSFFFSFARLPS